MPESRKPRVLLVGEANFLNSGYSTYGFECMKRLHASGRFELCELGCFGSSDDPRALDLPWKFIGNLPDPNDKQQVERYDKFPLNKFGAWKFEQTCLDFKPDIVWSFRDWWNDEHIQRSPFRRFFHWAYMPTVDAEPQDEQWLATFIDADSIFTYSDWGMDLLRRQTNNGINGICAAPPGAEIDVLKPLPDRAAYKKAMGLPEDALVVGTVMRNQKRKLFSDLIEAFAKFLAEAPDDIRSKTYLYLHTAYPDSGWDLPRLIKEFGVGHRTLFTYICRSCKEAYPAHFQDAVASCRACGNPTAEPPNNMRGVPRETLAKVLNLMDVYVQYATSEGFGLPQVEAAACGTPVFAVDYSAMSDVVRKVHGTPIAVQRFFREAETHCLRALPDNSDFVTKLIAFLRQPQSLRLRAGWKARKGVLEHYTYERTAKIWEDHFSGIALRPLNETWNSPPRFHHPNTKAPDGLSNEEWVRWCFAHVMGHPERADSYAAMRMVRDLNWGMTTGNMGGVIYNDASALGLEIEVTKQLFNRQKALEAMVGTANEWNMWEEARTKTAGVSIIGD